MLDQKTLEAMANKLGAKRKERSQLPSYSVHINFGEMGAPKPAPKDEYKPEAMKYNLEDEEVKPAKKKLKLKEK